MTSAALIPDRRRKYFPRNGGPRPSEADRQCGHRGIAAARAVLEAATQPEPDEHCLKPLTPAQVERARRGIAAARRALENAAPEA